MVAVAWPALCAHLNMVRGGRAMRCGPVGAELPWLEEALLGVAQRPQEARPAAGPFIILILVDCWPHRFVLGVDLREL